MKKAGIKLAVLGLIAGMLIGGLVRLESYAAKELMGLLEDELKASTPCKLVYDSANVSFITLTGEAIRPRVVCGNREPLKLDRITADFSVRAITDHKILLTRLNLYNASITGVGPESETYKFIDYLAAPISPEKDYPGRWHLSLQTLKLFPSTFVEEFSHSRLLGSNAELLMTRDADDNAVLQSTIGDVMLQFDDASLPEKHFNLKLGGVKGDVLITEHETNFRSIAIALDNAISNLTGHAIKIKQNAITGNSTHDFPLSYIGLPDWIKFQLSAKSTISGNLESPIFTGTITERENTTPGIDVGDRTPITFDNVEGSFSVDSNHRNPIVHVNELNGAGKGTLFSLARPITIINDQLGGKILLHADSVNLDPLILNGVDTEIILGGDIGQSKVSISGKASNVRFLSASINNFSFSADAEKGIVDLTAFHEGPNGESFRINGPITTAGNEPLMSALSYTTKNLPFSYVIGDAEASGALSSLRINGSGSVAGPFDSQRVSTQATFSVVGGALSEKQNIQSELRLEKGILTLASKNEENSIDSNLTMRLQEGAAGKWKLNLSKLKADAIHPALACSTIDASLDYSPKGGELFGGSGAFNVQDFRIGCDPYSITLAKPAALPITDGALSLSGVVFRGLEDTLSLDGKVSILNGASLKAKGTVPLAVFTGYFPSLDNLSGEITASASITGPLAAPQLMGEAEVTGGEFAAEEMDFGASDIHGKMKLSGNEILLQSIRGTLNGGDAVLDGTISIRDITKSNFELTLKDVLLQPNENMSIVADADVSLTTNAEGSPGIRGTVDIQSAEFQKNLDLVTMVRSLAQLLFATREVESRLSTLPKIGLDLAVLAKRNIIITTDLLGAELKGDLRVMGNLSSPTIDGSLETLSGWLGLKDRRFDITSGVIRFTPGISEPQLDLIGESPIRSRTGDSINVILDAKGPLVSPRISLSSDSGLSEHEILNLISAGGSTREETLVNTLGYGTPTRAYSPFEDIPLLKYSSLITGLTKLESLSIEPRYSIQTGSVEPVAVARKKLFDNFYLIGDTYLGATVNESRVGVLYNLTPSMNVLGYASTSSSSSSLAAGWDFTYTILASQKKFLEISIEGNREIRKSEILNRLHLRDVSRIDPADLPRLEEEVKKFYRTRGFYGAKVTATCEREDQYCRKLEIKIKEGRMRRLERMSLEGDDVTSVLGDSFIQAIDPGTPATYEFARTWRDKIVRKLRSEGYIGAKATPKYRQGEKRGSLVLVFVISAGKPVSFSFQNLKAFTPEELLKTINVFGRKLPFGNNTINILLKNIDQKYREAGYLYATISYTSKEDPETGRVNYIIDVQEGEQIPVEKVTFSGLNEITEARLRELLKPSGSKVVQSTFSPQYAVAEEIERNGALLLSILIEEGFPYASIENRLIPNDEKKTVTIEYVVTEGIGFKPKRLKVAGIPKKVDAPEVPDDDLSIPQINEYVSHLTAALRDSGYLTPEIGTELQSSSQTITVEVNTGKRTRISEIRLEGAVNIQEKVIRNALTVKPGDPWDAAKFAENRRKIFRLGLFSRVEFVPADGALDSLEEVLLIKVSEKPLQTLELGGGVNSEFGVHVFGEATDRSIFADGRSLSLRLDAFFDSTSGSYISKGIASGKYTDPSFLNSNYTLTEDLRYQKLEATTQEYDLARTSLASYLYQAWESGLSISAGHTILTEELSNVSSDAILSDLDSGTVRLGFLSGTLTYDKRDSPLSPTRGYTLGTEYKIAESVIGSEADFHEASLRGTYLIPFTFFEHNFTVGLGSRIGGAWTFGNTEEIPITQRYYLGGRSTIRGFKENSLGPRGLEGSVIGGDVLFANNLELQYHTSDSTSVHLFLDAGNVYLREFGFDGVRTSTGAGFRYISPIGPIGFDVGFPLKREDNESPYRIHFSIGSTF